MDLKTALESVPAIAFDCSVLFSGIANACVSSSH